MAEQLTLKAEKTMKYLIVIEKAGKNYSAYISDVPGCVATGKTPQEAKEHIKEALEFHLKPLMVFRRRRRRK